MHGGRQHRDDNEERYAYQANKLSHHRLRVWDEARRFVRLVSKNPIGDAELRLQATKAVKSAGCKIAKGSAVEVVAAYELATDIGETLPIDEVTRRGAAVASMLTGLIRK